ncbi:MAG: hypothetical protein A3K18_31605 [Lentisphaerae bacterium RIFOXYA12_64_32]|nr:MAG: hypothetical protein A3K18_31605 [Lentisphaerae bacterium RIFOXYA12_64_32]
METAIAIPEKETLHNRGGGLLYGEEQAAVCGAAGNGKHDLVANVGLVRNLKSHIYWTGTAATPYTDRNAWMFDALFGFQNFYNQNDMLCAWAVHDGNVAGTLPKPSAASSGAFPPAITDPYFTNAGPNGGPRGMNPYYHGRGIFSYDSTRLAVSKPGGGADVTVGARYAGGSMLGEALNGRLGGLAVFRRALTDEEMLRLHTAAHLDAL